MKQLKLTTKVTSPIVGKTYFHQGFYKSKGPVVVVGNPRDTYFDNFGGTVLHPGKGVMVQDSEGLYAEVKLDNLWEMP